MIARALAAGTPAAWVAGDEVYGGDAKLRARIRGHGLGYVMQIVSPRLQWRLGTDASTVVGAGL